MRALLLCAAASLAAITSPADAQSFAAGPGAGVSGGPFGDFASGPRDGTGHDGRRHRRSRNVVVFGDFGSSDAWALYNNRSWESGSYNDWWHDRPDRAYPRWMQSNQDCQRLWWGGGGWRC